MLRRLVSATLAISIAVVVLAGCQQAPSYPTKQIEYVVHSSTGSGTDVLARTISDIMSREKIVPVTMTVSNKSGGSGAVASNYVAEKKADPYVMYNISTVQLATPAQTGAGPYVTDFTAVANFAFDSNCIVVDAKSPYRTMQELIDASKKKPLSQGGGAITSSEAIGGHLIKKSTGAQWEFVSFNSGGEATTALLGGHVDFTNPSPAEVVEQVRAGKVRILAVNSEKRLDIWPDVPTLKELNIGYPTGMIRGLVMPKDVPADVVKFWDSAFTKMRATETWKKYIKDNALFEAAMGPQEYTTYLANSMKAFEGYITDMGLAKKK